MIYVKFTLFSILLFLGSFSQSQILDNEKGQAFTDKPFFNSSFIKKNKIKHLTGVYMYKKYKEGIQETKYKYVYSFDTEGRLTSSYETCPDDGSKDTVWNFYTYDAFSNLIVHRRSMDDGFNSDYYTYDSLQRLIKKEVRREVCDSSGNVLSSIIFYKETYRYFDNKNQLKRVSYNDYHLPFMEEIFYYDENGYLLKKERRIKMTSDVFYTTFDYNEKGLLSAIRKKKRGEDKFKEEWTFKYDELNNLLEKKIYRDGIFTTDIQIVYNSKTKLMSSVITRQVSTGFFMIIRFKNYQFYD